METEAQILFRYERDKEEGKLGEEEFDPLELDRFSTLQQLSRGLMETVGDLANINKILETEQKDTETLLLQQSRITTDLQDGLMRTRMVSFNQLAPRLKRIVRQTCRPLGKQAELSIKGAGMELDRSILDRMTAPLEHLLRNAVSHGIEDPKRRKKKKKPENGTITIELTREGNDVVMTVSDDGKGLDFKAIRERAEKSGLLLDGSSASEGDLTQFILEHGFSTADSVNQIAGRGVGLDVVVSEVKQLGGTMEIDSEPGSGTKFIIYLPLTLAITDALLLKAGSEIYAAPYANVESVVRINRDELVEFYESGKGVYTYGDNEYQMRYLGALLDKGSPNLTEQKKRIPLLLVRAGKHRVAIHVDEVIGHRQIVVKSVGPQLSTIRWITGGTILGDGRVALILDINALVRKDAAMKTEVEESIQISSSEAVEEKIKIMVVDDSITVRKVTGRLLERHGMAVETAKDGVEALAMLQDYHPDVMLLDIEMPRMDGFEVARNMRSSEQLSDIPIIIITSRTGDKHRDHAMDLGVKRYLGKPYQETDLLENIQSVLKESKS
jgi:chemosensory pili system protein ChpA (sensor histidine kinase/response regulator)